MKETLKIHRAYKYCTPTVSVTAKLLRESGLSENDHVEAEVVGNTIVFRKAGQLYVAPQPQPVNDQGRSETHTTGSR